MSMVFYEAGSLTIGVNADEVAEKLGELRNKTPAVIKVAANYTARETRKEMLRRAMRRYAVTSKGKEKIKGLQQTVTATNGSPGAALEIGGKYGRISDFSYFRHSPKKAYPGTSWATGPDTFRAQVLKAGGMKPLTGQGKFQKGFLAKFQSGHLGMIQRQKGDKSERYTTYTGKRRWINKATEAPDLTRTYEAPSGTAMHRTVWFKEEANDYAAETLERKLNEQIAKVIAREAAKGR